PPVIALTIDGQPVLAREGQTIWEAERDAGIDIPVLCHTPRMRPVGVCRMCAVDIGGRTLAAACVRAAEPGMTVETRSERVERSRRVLIELLMSDHEAPCARERTTGDCELEALARRYGVSGQWSVTADKGAAGSDHGPGGGTPGADEGGGGGLSA